MKAVIVDDAKQARELLNLMLGELTPELDVVGEAENLMDAVEVIRKHQPELVFLDIEMPGKSGLQLLEQFSSDEINFEIIFTTAYNQYALQAFRLSAVDYLLKPIREQELVQAVEKAIKRKTAEQSQQRLQALVSNLSIENKQVLCVPLNYGYEFVPLNELEYIEADGAYAHLFLVNGKKITVSKNLKYFQDRVESFSGFVRIHRSCIINLAHMTSFVKSDRGTIRMKNGAELTLSRTSRTEFLAALELMKK